MAKRACLAIIIVLWAVAGLMPSAFAQETKRQIAITENGDYFGFDLRSEKDVSLDQCKSI